jgi:2-polyprenyl-3-methyl-5-hydroxy-6-metoxy-1,4-benzoquinol methylase
LTGTREETARSPHPLDDKLRPYQALAELLQRQFKVTPQYEEALIRRFGAADSQDLQVCDGLASNILALTKGGLDEYLRSYDFICRVVLDEEIFFRRNGRYRLQTFEEALREVYLNETFMHDYMRGLLLTQVYWANHTACIRYFETVFLAGLPPDARFLDIGPGHGLFTARAIASGRCASVTGWDVSPTSLAETERSLNTLGYRDGFTLQERDILGEVGEERFDGIVFSEVLEHLDQPAEALRAIRRLLSPRGRLFVNVPVNSPAPDHIFLLRSPEEAVSFVESAGFRTVDTAFFPMTGATLERARKHDLTISICIVAEAA